jgi:ADP-heptose:LPS heptosyltransferase
MQTDKPLYIRGGGGLGDAIYVHIITRHLVKQGKKVIPCTDYTELFRHLPVTTVPHRKNEVDIVCHYTMRKMISTTNQFEDCCINSGLEPSQVENKMEWVKRPYFKNQKPYICVPVFRPPMGRDDGFALELLPDRELYQKIINKLSQHYTIVQIGSGKKIKSFSNVHIDLVDKTSVNDIVNIVAHAKGVFGYCSYLVPLAEAFDIPALYLWARQGLRSQKTFIHSIKPSKIFAKDSSMYLIDDYLEKDVERTVDAFLAKL